MKNLVVFFIGIFLMFPSWAMESIDVQNITGLSMVHLSLPVLKDLDWKVGEFQERQVKKGSLKVGQMKSWVDREVGSAFWLLNEVKIIFKKKQLVEALIDRDSGEILKYIVDGEDKNPPDIAELEKCQEHSEVTEAVKVPAGQFITQRYLVQCDEDFLLLWVNENQVNMGGHVRQAVLQDGSDLNSVEYLVELTRFGSH